MYYADVSMLWATSHAARAYSTPWPYVRFIEAINKLHRTGAITSKLHKKTALRTDVYTRIDRWTTQKKNS